MSSRFADRRSTEDRRTDSEALAFGATEMQRFTTPRHNLHLCLSAGSFQWRIGAMNESKLLGEPMSELDVFGFIGMNRSSLFDTLSVWRLNAAGSGRRCLLISALLWRDQGRRHDLCTDWRGHADLFHHGRAKCLFYDAEHAE